MTTDPTEAYIEAVWPRYPLYDIDVEVVAGEGVFVKKEIADRSDDLKEALRQRAVTVRWVRRCLVSKPPSQPAPPVNRRMRHTPPKKEVKAVVDEEAIAAKVAKILGTQLDDRDAKLRDELRGMIIEAQRTGSAINPEALVSLLQQSVKEAVESNTPNFVRVVDGKEESVHADDPLYIPSKLVPTNVKASIKVKESTADASSADSAADKLRALRRKKNDE